MIRIWATIVMVLAGVVLANTIQIMGGSLLLLHTQNGWGELSWPALGGSIVILAAIALVPTVWVLCRRTFRSEPSGLFWAGSPALIAGVGIGSSPIWLDYPIRYGVSLPLIAFGLSLIGLQLLRERNRLLLEPRPNGSR